MSGGGTGGGGIIRRQVVVLHPSVIAAPVLADVDDVQAWCDSLDSGNPLKAALEAYLAAIPSD